MLTCPISLQGDVRAGPLPPTKSDAQYGSWIGYTDSSDLLGAMQAALKEAEDVYNTKFKDSYEDIFLYIAIKKPMLPGDEFFDGPLNEKGYVAWKLSLQNRNSV